TRRTYGYEKTVNNLKRNGLMKINGGKRDLRSSGVGLLALKLMTDTPTRKGHSWGTTLFGWCYFYMEWTEDCLSIEEQGHKGDQKGSEKFGKHVYANPYTPCQCPILALAVHLFSCPERTATGKQQQFIDTDNKKRFGRTLQRVIAALDKEETCILGCNPDDFGTHSLRKGSSSYALGQVYVISRYIHFGEGADQLCGTMIAGFNSKRFA
ncbi:hypothetical protein F441_13979, partial [Phytophthora nicotianae CJ01A1]